MATLGEVGDALRRALTKVDESIAAHRQAAEFAEEARDLLAVAGEGSSDEDVGQACSTFTTVVDGIVEPEGQLSGLAHAAELIREYARVQGIGEAAPGGPAVSAPVSPLATSKPNRPEPQEPVAVLRGQLPQPVELGSGQKTHGRWFRDGQPGDAQAVVSGRDADAEAIDDLFREEYGLPRNRRLQRTADVEQKVAMQMRRDGIRHASVVINNVPCRGEYSCENLLPVILPLGFTLTVHGTNGYRKTFEGGQRPPWKR